MMMIMMVVAIQITNNLKCLVGAINWQAEEGTKK